MNVLVVGDVVGRPGRRALLRWLPGLCNDYLIDLVVVNGENAAGGLGATPAVLDEVFEAGAHAVTLGNHTWRKKELASALDSLSNVVRPANYPDGVPGTGAIRVTLADGRRAGIVSLLGRVFLSPNRCPFEVGRAEVARLRETTPVVIVDMHAEATAEKVAMGWFLDGACTAVVGTHTHVQTADERLLPKGTAYITDVGMCGPRNSIIGMERERVINRFLTGMPVEFQVARGPTVFNAVLIQADDDSGRALAIERIVRTQDE